MPRIDKLLILPTHSSLQPPFIAAVNSELPRGLTRNSSPASFTSLVV